MNNKSYYFFYQNFEKGYMKEVLIDRQRIVEIRNRIQQLEYVTNSISIKENNFKKIVRINKNLQEQHETKNTFQIQDRQQQNIEISSSLYYMNEEQKEQMKINGYSYLKPLAEQVRTYINSYFQIQEQLERQDINKLNQIQYGTQYNFHLIDKTNCIQESQQSQPKSSDLLKLKMCKEIPEYPQPNNLNTSNISSQETQTFSDIYNQASSNKRKKQSKQNLNDEYKKNFYGDISPISTLPKKNQSSIMMYPKNLIKQLSTQLEFLASQSVNLEESILEQSDESFDLKDIESENQSPKKNLSLLKMKKKQDSMQCVDIFCNEIKLQTGRKMTLKQ